MANFKQVKQTEKQFLSQGHGLHYTAFIKQWKTTVSTHEGLKHMHNKDIIYLSLIYLFFVWLFVLFCFLLVLLNDLRAAKQHFIVLRYDYLKDLFVRSFVYSFKYKNQPHFCQWLKHLECCVHIFVKYT